ncbi:H-NS histone family protein [Burkholderia metallica]|uniref:H-NS histone family protein n=1 Tax=Burkholderia metallica TaxID=488729 RepID=UPI00157B98C0|nr:H-NS histone family protein [Burkholderia metallica]NTZ88393.1 H-NS histone family protein [Burkholderia metallica]
MNQHTITENIVDQYERLLMERQAVDEKINEIRLIKRDEVISHIVKLMQEFIINPSEIEQKFSDQYKNTRRRARPRYFDPATGSTWSGRGKRPRWMKGREPSEFLIQEHSA